MKDATLRKTGAMPNAANTVNTNILTLPQQSVRPFTTDFRVRLYNGVSTGANSKNITYRIYGSNESNGANAVQLTQNFVVAGNGTNHVASNREVTLPPDSDKLYIFGSATGEANGGDAGDGVFGIEVII